MNKRIRKKKEKQKLWTAKELKSVKSKARNFHRVYWNPANWRNDG